MATQFRELMFEEMTMRSHSQRTKTAYLQSMTRLCSHFKKTADQITIPEIREYLLQLLKESNLKPRTINREISAFRFFYTHVMGWNLRPDALPKQRAPRFVPMVLSEQEVASMINACDSLFYKALIMLTYSSGLRQSEVRNLKISDVDSKRMILHIREGKGGKDRQALLSPVALKMLRTYWRCHRLHRPVKSDYLFIGTNRNDGKLGEKMSHTALGYIVSRAAELAGIKKKFTHIFYATPLQIIF